MLIQSTLVMYGFGAFLPSSHNGMFLITLIDYLAFILFLTDSFRNDYFKVSVCQADLSLFVSSKLALS